MLRPVVYNIVGEVPSTRVRAKSIVLARNAYNVANVAFVNIVTYRQLSANEWNWGQVVPYTGKPGLK